MNPELAVLYAKLDVYEEALRKIRSHCPGMGENPPWSVAEDALWEATKLSQPASQPEKP